ncbi:MAG: hypothetical protein Q8O93_00335 [bacterium]|nr:hypothetical protein [bacterium]
MDRRIWGIIIVIASLAIIAGIVYLIFFYRFSPAAAPLSEQPAAEQAPAADPPAAEKPDRPAVSVAPAAPAKPAEVGRNELVKMSSAFAERFGSYSNQSDYGNIRDLRIFMTAKLKTWADNYINDARSRQGDSAIYYGIITKAISGEAKQFDPDTGQAEILIKTQRRESIGVSGNNATFYQDIIIKYEKENGAWLLDGIYWQAK